jgi:hypothetical protein
LARIPLLFYGIFLVWKVGLHPDFFTPIDWLDLAIHEMGHVIFAPFGQWMGVSGGSITQLLAPLAGTWQFLRQRDYFGAAFALDWLGESLGNLSVYIGDARKQDLPLANLFGGDPIHDWNFLLGSMNRLAQDQVFARRVQALGVLMVALYLWFGLWLLWNMVSHQVGDRQ